MSNGMSWENAGFSKKKVALIRYIQYHDEKMSEFFLIGNTKCRGSRKNSFTGQCHMFFICLAFPNAEKPIKVRNKVLNLEIRWKIRVCLMNHMTNLLLITRKLHVACAWNCQFCTMAFIVCNKSHARSVVNKPKLSCCIRLWHCIDKWKEDEKKTHIFLIFQKYVEKICEIFFQFNAKIGNGLISLLGVSNMWVWIRMNSPFAWENSSNRSTTNARLWHSTAQHTTVHVLYDNL